MAKYQVFCLLLLSFCLGIVVFQLLENVFDNVFYIFLIAAGIYMFWRQILIIFIVSFFVLGLSWTYIYEKNIDQNHIAYFNGKGEITFKGYISDDPDQRVDHTKLRIKTKIIVKKDGSTDDVYGQILVMVPRFPKYEYGNELLVSCRLREPPDEDDFSYKNYLKRYHVYSICSYPKVSYLNEGYSFFYRPIYSLRRYFEDSLSKSLPEPAASLAAGILLGSRRGLPQDLMDDFQASGLTHIIAISGSNITLVSLVSLFIFGIFGRHLKIILTISMILIFTFLTGASSAVVRAAIMGLINLAAMTMNVRTIIASSFVLTLTLMLLINPFIALFDVGFQLSFLATLGVVYLGPILDRLKIKIPEVLGFREAFIMTIAAQIMTLPVLMSNFGILSIISPLANLVVAPLVPLAMLGAFLSVLCSYFSFPSYFVLQAIVVCAKFFASLPLATVIVPRVSFMFTFSYYIILCLVLYFLRFPSRPQTS